MRTMNHRELLMSNDLVYSKNSNYYIENVNIKEISDKFGTPCYIYSKSNIIKQLTELQSALKDINHLICFAVKSNSNLSILKIFNDLGCGFDIVSAGELKRVQQINNNTEKVVFSGVGKSFEEIQLALSSNILAFNVESEDELVRINKIAKEMGVIAKISIRVNPNVDAKTHPYISTGLKDNKFGINEENALALYQHANKLNNIKITGIDCHIGSQITDLSPFEDAFKKISSLVDALEKDNIKIDHIDIGGGIGIDYNDEVISPLKYYADMITKHLKKHNKKIILEPGRLLVGKSGLLLTKVEYIKKSNHKNFIIVDAAMNDLMRPALYNAHHDVINLTNQNEPNNKFDIVGPICETGDFLAEDRLLTADENDLIAILDAGAYGFSMSSNYNSRPRISEVMVNNDQFTLIRDRESFEDLIKHEIKHLNT